MKLGTLRALILWLTRAQSKHSWRVAFLTWRRNIIIPKPRQLESILIISMESMSIQGVKKSKWRVLDFHLPVKDLPSKLVFLALRIKMPSKEDALLTREAHHQSLYSTILRRNSQVRRVLLSQWQVHSRRLPILGHTWAMPTSQSFVKTLSINLTTSAKWETDNRLNNKSTNSERTRISRDQAKPSLNSIDRDSLALITMSKIETLLIDPSTKTLTSDDHLHYTFNSQFIHNHLQSDTSLHITIIHAMDFLI